MYMNRESKKYRKKQLFGKNITPSCKYCNNAIFDNDGFICTQNRVLDDCKCKKFDYNPMLRIPDAPARKMLQFKKEDFEL